MDVNCCIYLLHFFKIVFKWSSRHFTNKWPLSHYLFMRQPIALFRETVWLVYLLFLTSASFFTNYFTTRTTMLQKLLNCWFRIIALLSSAVLCFSFPLACVSSIQPYGKVFCNKSETLENAFTIDVSPMAKANDCLLLRSSLLISG